MIIDSHAHFEPALLNNDQLFVKMKLHGIDKTILISRITDPPVYKKADSVMGVQRKLMQWGWPRPLLRIMDNGFHTVPGQWNPWFRSLSGKPGLFKILLKPDNEQVAQVIAAYPDQLLGWLFINPKLEDWQDEFNRWKSAPGMIGIKAHPFWHRYLITQLYPLAQKAREEQLPLLVHLGFDCLKNVKKFCTDFPELTIIFAHAAKPFYQDLWPVIKSTPNKFIDLAGHHVDGQIVAQAVKALGPERCLFGTDDPYGDEDYALKLKSWIEQLNIQPSDKEYIYYKNILKIINTKKFV